ncbi:hypothetical protein Pint_29029 [Pistacia integerrima]|uniref:Uncharacterized protein n=1 Tax=Pistacia integerrima TaxID=434235 RepID=A0ACC0X3E7_9ROSI|nr:hypothetical protein Pint_29029 [Pistacia integerrima]
MGIIQVEAKFGKALTSTHANIMDVLQKLGSLSNDRVPPEKLFGVLPHGRTYLKSSAGSLSLDQLNDQLLEIVSVRKLIAEQLDSALEARNHSGNPSEEASYCNGDCSEVEAKFGEALKSTHANIMDVLQKLGSLGNDHVPSEKLFGSVTSRENILVSSGQNPLQKLVLIIGDGRFHEKEHLKRWVRDLLVKRRMVAFLLMDSPQESIIDLKELPFQGKEIKVSKYLDSFPFPYYIVLRNIEALPRTLADLLRQWFELMENTRE